MRRYLWVAIAVLLLDQLSKSVVADYLTRHGEIALTSFLSLVLVHNTGAAFGVLSQAGGWQNIFFIVVAAVACIVILLLMSRLPREEATAAVALALILGGAAGNLLDRLIHGYVIDFIDVYYRSWHWPAFNIADSAISAGAVLLALDALGWHPWKRRRMS
jgi:signal peptidase II